MSKFQSTKVIDGFSTCFRQWKAEDTHCKYLHGYAISFKVWFEGDLDYRNWVVDFGFLKRSNKVKINPQHHSPCSKDFLSGLSVGDWFKHMFDHTIVIAKDDPEFASLMRLDHMKIAQVRVLDNVGCEMFAKFVFDVLNLFLYYETIDRVKVVRVECFEHAKNSAIYEEREF